MRFEILNVDHGFAAYAQATDGSVLLFDCGESGTCRPSDYLASRGVRSIRRFFVTNYDEDHIADLPRLRRSIRIEVLSRNQSLNSTQVRSLKLPPISPAMSCLLEMMDSYTGPVTAEQLEPPGLRVWCFHNGYPVFRDTNNLSLLTFIDVGQVSFVLPGDLERAGWMELLEIPHVQGLLGRVSVFVASHHGRENGYCEEVFQYCSPSIIVISDGPIEYDSQRMAGVYAPHAKGEWFNAATGPEFRKVISTRNDGHLFWNV